MENDTAAPSLPRMIDTDELSAATGIPKQTIWRLVRSNEIPHRRFGRAVRYPADAVARWLRGEAEGDDA